MRQGLVSAMAVLGVVVFSGSVMSAAEISGDEASLYAKATAEKDAAARAALLESYLQQYPEGAYKIQSNYFLTLAYRELNQPEKMMQSGEETLKLDAENIDVLLLLADRYSNQAATFEKSIAYSDRCIQALEKKEAGAPPANVTAEQWHGQCEKLKKGAAYTKALVLGKKALAGKDYAGAEAPLKQAYSIQKNPMIPFWLGIVYSKSGKVDDAIAMLCEAVVLAGPAKDQAQKELERLYQQKNQSLDGLQQKIDEARARVSPNT